MVSPAVANPIARLHEALSAEIGTIREFIDLLRREQDLLKQGETETLLPLIESKNSLANALASLAQAREANLAGYGFPSGRAGMEAWVDKAGLADLRQSWHTLLTLAAEARELNQLSGKLIGLHMNHNQQAFAAMMRATDRAMTYGPDGQQQTGLGGRILGTA